MEDVFAFGREEAVDSAADAFNEGVDGSGRILPEQRLGPGKTHLDGIHVGALGRQIEDPGASGGDDLTDAGDVADQAVPTATRSVEAARAAEKAMEKGPHGRQNRPKRIVKLLGMFGIARWPRYTYLGLSLGELLTHEYQYVHSLATTVSYNP